MQPENARDKNVELQVDPEKLAMPEFKALWQRISLSMSWTSIPKNLWKKQSLPLIATFSKIFFKVELGTMNEIQSKEAASFVKEIWSL